jgi:hypothetical protein
MSTYADELISRFQSKGTLVDSNLLLLLLVGYYDLNLLSESGFKRVAKYTIDDFRVLERLLALFVKSVTTPHVLTEVSNLAGQLPEHHKARCFQRFVDVFKTFAELNRSSMASARRPEFPQFGLTDCVIADVAADYLVVTDDLRLCARLERAGLQPLNFNHVRTFGWHSRR